MNLGLYDSRTSMSPLWIGQRLSKESGVLDNSQHKMERRLCSQGHLSELFHILRLAGATSQRVKVWPVLFFSKLGCDSWGFSMWSKRCVGTQPLWVVSLHSCILRTAKKWLTPQTLYCILNDKPMELEATNSVRKPPSSRKRSICPTMSSLRVHWRCNNFGQSWSLIILRRYGIQIFTAGLDHRFGGRWATKGLSCATGGPTVLPGEKLEIPGEFSVLDSHRGNG